MSRNNNMSTPTSSKGFVKLPGPINFNDDDSDDEIPNQQKNPQKKDSFSKIQTPKLSTPRNTKTIGERSPQTEVMLSPMSFSPQNISTPKRNNNSLFTPNSPVPTPKQQENILITSTLTTFHDETKNYSTIFKNQSPVVASNTNDASIGETYRKLYYQRRTENLDLLHKRSQLELYLRRSKLENQQLLARQRESNQKLEEASPRDIKKHEQRIKKAEDKLKVKRIQQETDPTFAEIVRIKQKVRDFKQEEQQVVDGLVILNSLMSYTLQDSDIENILMTNRFQGEIGKKFTEFLLTLQKAIPKLEQPPN